jgi:hypothetical protein
MKKRSGKMKKPSTRSTRKIRGGGKKIGSPKSNLNPDPNSNPKPIPPDGKRRTTRSTGYQAYRKELHAWMKKEEEMKKKEEETKKK